MWALIMLGCIGVAITVIRNHISVATQLWAQVFVIALLGNLFLGNEQEYEPEYEQEDYVAYYPKQKAGGGPL